MNFTSLNRGPEVCFINQFVMEYWCLFVILCSWTAAVVETLHGIAFQNNLWVVRFITDCYGMFYCRTTPLTERGRANIFPLWHWVGWKNCVQKRWLVLLLQLEHLWSGKHEHWPTTRKSGVWETSEYSTQVKELYRLLVAEDNLCSWLSTTLQQYPKLRSTC